MAAELQSIRLSLCTIPANAWLWGEIPGTKPPSTDRCLLCRMQEHETHCDAGADHLRIARQVCRELRNGGRQLRGGVHADKVDAGQKPGFRQLSHLDAIKPSNALRTSEPANPSSTLRWDQL